MKKLANKYYLTIMFFLITSITTLSPIFIRSRSGRIWRLWFIIFSTFTMFANEYLANNAKVNISKRKLKVTAGIVSLIIILAVFLFFGFWTDWSYL
ncbi:hypothetical protein SAMN04487792_1517 [Lactobacillus bombicola]|uniref:Uncharacterized protein n=1 Tax=Lactobacillus bombicola TaxID=1505723 RepID=A0A1I1TLX0_9LACO|nr:hypothetical protein [Lactobacillus bombicola]MCO6528377.1 hypothetical protein [Lactobacillus sp.]SFD59642.1 hypothetical protein SAMN04487792_1517 [Lactobacillus bombicola]